MPCDYGLARSVAFRDRTFRQSLNNTVQFAASARTSETSLASECSSTVRSSRSQIRRYFLISYPVSARNRHRDQEGEAGAFIWRRVNSELATKLFHYTGHNSQAQSCNKPSELARCRIYQPSYLILASYVRPGATLARFVQIHGKCSQAVHFRFRSRYLAQ